MSDMTPQQLAAPYAWTMTIQWANPQNNGWHTATRMGTVAPNPGENRYQLQVRLLNAVTDMVGAPGATILFLSIERNDFGS